MNKNTQHWNNIYRSKESCELGWYQESPDISLQILQRFAPKISQSIIDIGCGVSSLVDHLLDLKFSDITLLDLSTAALETVRNRLNEREKHIAFLQGDITQIKFDRLFNIWHDRTVFHFLTCDSEQRAYMNNLQRSLSPNGIAIIGTFSLAGANKCSGLNVVQYDDNKMKGVIGKNLKIDFSMQNTHTTPSGRQQDYRYFVLKHVNAN